MSWLNGYARVSTAAQDPAQQHDVLQAAGCHRTFLNGAFDALDVRSQLADLYHPHPSDTLVVWRLDRSRPSPPSTPAASAGAA